MRIAARFWRLACALGLILVLVGAGTWWHFGPGRARAAWRAALPPRPNLESWPAPFLGRIDQCYAALRKFPPNIEALTELGRLFLANGFSAEAEKIQRQISKDKPNDAHAAYFLAVIYAGEGRLEDALPFWKEAIAIDPSYIPARVKLADGLRKLNRPDEAKAVYAEVLRISPGNIYAIYGFAVLSVEAGDWEEAKSYLQDAVSRDPSFWGAFSLLATVADHFGDSVVARRARARAVQIGRFKDIPDPWTESLAEDCYDVYRLQVIGSTRAITGDVGGAIPPLQRAVDLAPNDPKARRDLGKVYLSSNDIVHAQEQLSRAIELEPTDPISYLEMEKVYKAKNDIAGAQALLLEGLKHAEDSPALHFEEGLVLLAEGRPAEALVNMERARDLAPENVSTYEKLAIILLRLGRTADAVSNINIGLKLDPNDGPLWMLSGRVHILKGEAAEAEKSLNQARQLGAPDANIEEFSQIFARQFGRKPEPKSSPLTTNGH